MKSAATLGVSSRGLGKQGNLIHSRLSEEAKGHMVRVKTSRRAPFKVPFTLNLKPCTALEDKKPILVFEGRLQKWLALLTRERRRCTSAPPAQAEDDTNGRTIFAWWGCVFHPKVGGCWLCGEPGVIPAFVGCAVSARGVFSRGLGNKAKQRGTQVQPRGGGGDGPRASVDPSGHALEPVNKDGNAGRGGSTGCSPGRSLRGLGTRAGSWALS